jgi:hypothetical protein
MYISYLAGVQKVQKQDIENWLLRPFFPGEQVLQESITGATRSALSGEPTGSLKRL